MELFGLSLFLLLTIALALAFDFINGFHDSANAIATVVATKVLSPGQAVLMAGFFNFIGPFVFTLAVANTVGKGIIDLTAVGPVGNVVVVEVIFAALMGALIWNLITWYYGIPSSSSHALVGGLVGAAIAGAGTYAVVMPKWSEWSSSVSSLLDGTDFWRLGILEWIVVGAVGGLAAGFLAWAWSRAPARSIPFVLAILAGLLAWDSWEGLGGDWTSYFFPAAWAAVTLVALLVALRGNDDQVNRSAFGLFLSAGILYGFGVSLAASHVSNWLSMQAFEGALLILSFTFMGAVAGVLFWAMTQQKLDLKNLPAFVIFGSAVAVVSVTLSGALVMGGVTKTLLFMIVSPMLGFLAGFLLASVVSWTARESSPNSVSVGSKRLQLGSAAFYALTHGTNDAQKTMGVIGVLLVGAGLLTNSKTLDIPAWVIISSAAAMGLGTMFGGWRIVKTMASKLTHLRPYQGFAAETGGGVVLVAMAQAGIPVSTTHAITASIMGVGATRRASAVRWGTGRRIITAWIITIPASAIMAWLTFWIVHWI